MTTVESAPRRSSWLDDTTHLAAVEARAARMQPVDWRRALVALLTLVPFLLGVAVGGLVRTAVWATAAAQEGYHAGRAAPERVKAT